MPRSLAHYSYPSLTGDEIKPIKNMGLIQSKTDERRQKINTADDLTQIIH